MTERDPSDWYVEESFCVHQLIEAEAFTGRVWDPACGSGTIPRVHKQHDISAIGTDLRKRGFEDIGGVDFLSDDWQPGEYTDIVTNPPYGVAMEFIERARSRADRVCVLVPMRFLNSGRRADYFRLKPPARIWILGNRPSMPPGEALWNGLVSVGGGKIDYCWVVFERGHEGGARVDWLHWPKEKIAASREADKALWRARRAA